MDDVTAVEKRTRVLLVEDEPQICDIATEALEEQGFEVSGLTGPSFKAGIEAQFERWAKIVKATGFSAD